MTWVTIANFKGRENTPSKSKPKSKIQKRSRELLTLVKSTSMNTSHRDSNLYIYWLNQIPWNKQDRKNLYKRLSVQLNQIDNVLNARKNLKNPVSSHKLLNQKKCCRCLQNNVQQNSTIKNKTLRLNKSLKIIQSVFQNYFGSKMNVVRSWRSFISTTLTKSRKDCWKKNSKLNFCGNRNWSFNDIQATCTNIAPKLIWTS